MTKAIRGKIFRFLEKDGTSYKLCLVISSNMRQTDKIISILMLGTRDGSDSIQVMEGFYIHTGLVTYCDRKRLGDEVADVDQRTMSEIEKGIAYSLGF